jgi:hypothetical protein
MSTLGEDTEAEAMDAKRVRIRMELEVQGLLPEEIEEVLMDMDADEEE